MLRGIVREYGGIQIWAIYPLVTHLTFPILLLSMLETGSALNPFSPPVWRTLRWAWKAWVAFYIESAVVLAAAATVAAAAYWLAGPWGVALVTPLLIAAVFLYARLLGRLAWKAQSITAEREAAERANDGES